MKKESKGGGRAVFMVVEQSSEARLRTPSPIGGPLNPGGLSSQTQIALFLCLYTSFTYSIVLTIVYINNTLSYPFILVTYTKNDFSCLR
jgi:hypothetical protein